MKIINSVSEMQEYVKGIKNKGKSIGFVPTLGFLHKGHQSLMERARKENDILIVSIFVNPLQFRKDKFEQYPRDLEMDKRLAEESKADIIFAPTVEEIFPSYRSIELLCRFQSEDYKNRLSNEFSIDRSYESDLQDLIRVPANLVFKMDGKLFPQHFDGVATIVFKLFKVIEPDGAYFGEKDIQQLAIIKLGWEL